MRRTALKKRRSRKDWTNEDWRQEGVKWAKLIAKHRDNYVCVTCGKSADQGYQIHGSHILPESKFHRLSVEPINIMAQCFTCHSLWHEHPKGQNWFDEMYPTRVKDLFKLQADLESCIKPNYAKIHDKLKEQYNSIIN